MTKICPNCGSELPDEAKFCVECGFAFQNTPAVQQNSILKTSNLFLVLIAAVIIVGAAFILTYNGDNTSTQSEPADNVEHVALTITDVGGYDGDSSSKRSYTLYTSALFTSVPDDKKGYVLKTIYYDKNGSQIGQETESLEYVYYDTDYAISFGFYTAYTIPDPDHVEVQVIKDGKVIDNYTETIDTNKIDYLN
ncbi:MAG: zinc ribbon domain-containing protein [Methanobrevibacter sp.]|nr:zinc ribbon domain-containing protein [Methanobrevibacter sp.]